MIVIKSDYPRKWFAYIDRVEYIVDKTDKGYFITPSVTIGTKKRIIKKIENEQRN